MKARKLPIALKGFSSLYLEPALRLAILKASGAFDDWLSMNFIHLYASEYQTGSLIYRDGYCKLFYESKRPAVLHAFFHEIDWPAADAVPDDLAGTCRTMAEEARRLLGMMLRYASAEPEIRARVWEDAVDSLRRIQHRDRNVTVQLLRWLE